MKKIVVMIVVVIFILTLFTGCISSNNGDIPCFLDQTQTRRKEGACVDGTSYDGVAQSFKSSYSYLSKVEIMITYQGEVNDEKLKVSIKKDIDSDENLVSSYITSSDAPKNTYEWVTVDFSDISITPGGVYYLVLESPKHTCNYAWGRTYHSINPVVKEDPSGGYIYYNEYSQKWEKTAFTDYYLNGCSWYQEYQTSSNSFKWYEFEGNYIGSEGRYNYDYCFKTYGRP